MHPPAAGDLLPAKPSAQAAAVRCCKLALALVEQVEVEGDPAEVVVTKGRQPCADLGGEHQRTPSHTNYGIYRFWYRKGSSIRVMLAGQATPAAAPRRPGNAAVELKDLNP